MSERLPRVALVCAEPSGVVSGNNTSIDRFDRRLRARGLDVRLFRLPDLGGADGVAGLVRAVHAFAPEVVHCLHARHAGPAAAAAAEALGVPLVVTSGGTDIDQDTFDPSRAGVVQRTLAKAKALLVTHPAAYARALELNLPLKVLRVTKGAEPPPPAPPRDPERFGARADEVLFVLPAGVRPVKNNRFPLEPLARLREEGLPVRLLYAGPARDAEYSAALRRDLAGRPFASWPGTFLGAEREALYATADVVLNVSHSEGGANAILEAMIRRCCVLGSSIPGNVLFLAPSDGLPEAGRIYRADETDDPRVRRHDAEDFLRRARELAASPDLRRRLADAARERAVRWHDPSEEVEGILAAYRAVLGP